MAIELWKQPDAYYACCKDGVFEVSECLPFYMDGQYLPILEHLYLPRASLLSSAEADTQTTAFLESKGYFVADEFDLYSYYAYWGWYRDVINWSKTRAKLVLREGLYDDYLLIQARNYLKSCPPNNVLVTYGDTDTYYQDRAKGKS